MPPNILSSHIVTIPVLDALLSSTISPPAPAKRIQILSTKLAILTNRPSLPTKGQPFEVELQILRCRLDLAATYLRLAGSVSVGANGAGGVMVGSGAGAGVGARAVDGLKLAESELNLVEKECKGIIKRYSRLVKLERDKLQARAQAQAYVEAEAEAEAEALETEAQAQGQSPSLGRSPTLSPGISVVGEAKTGDMGHTTTESTLTNEPTRTEDETGADLSTQTSRLTLSDVDTAPLDSSLILPETPSSSRLDSDMTTPPCQAQAAIMTPSSSASTSTSTPSTPLTPSTISTDTIGGMTKKQTRLKMISEIRIEGMKMSIIVEDRLGRMDKKARLEGLVHKLEAG